VQANGTPVSHKESLNSGILYMQSAKEALKEINKIKEALQSDENNN
jgi:hypothetical protein